MLIAKGNNLFYYTMKSETSNHLYEIDFLTFVKDKICPLEVKSGNYRTHKSLDAFCKVNSNPRIPFVTQDSLFVNENPVL